MLGFELSVVGVSKTDSSMLNGLELVHIKGLGVGV